MVFSSYWHHKAFFNNCTLGSAVSVLLYIPYISLCDVSLTWLWIPTSWHLLPVIPNYQKVVDLRDADVVWQRSHVSYMSFSTIYRHLNWQAYSFRPTVGRRSRWTFIRNNCSQLLILVVHGLINYILQTRKQPECVLTQVYPYQLLILAP